MRDCLCQRRLVCPRFPFVPAESSGSVRLLFAAAIACAAALIPAGVPAAPAPPNIVARPIQLSFTSPQRCIQLLQTFGFATGMAGKPVNAKRLPYIVAVPESKTVYLPNPKAQRFPTTETDAMEQLLVFFDKNHPEQYGEVLQKVRDSIDVPARQIMIEAMVLEISSSSLADLGVQWDLDRSALAPGNWLNKHTTGTLRIGNLVLPNGDPLTNPTANVTFSDVFRRFQLQLEALVIAKKARVLSRPSVLTLDNRMAFINVSEEIPVASSHFLSNGSVSQVSFTEKTAGIQLTVRPRVSADGREIGMQITASVTSEIPGEEEIVKDFNGNTVATSPRLSVREVQTYARIANKTPFIIGGLISEDEQKQDRKVPLLGNIPVLGYLFKTHTRNHGKREVIIVITPHVLPKRSTVTSALPKDEEAFDNFGNKLFRNAYRIRAENVFDLSFLTQNQTIRGFQAIADMMVQDNYALAQAYPIRCFVNGRIPGEKILVCREIYEVIKQKHLEENVNPDRLIFFNPQKDSQAGFTVAFLTRYLRQLAAADPQFPDIAPRKTILGKIIPTPTAGVRHPAKALVMSFEIHRKSGVAQDLMSEPVPKLEIVDCPSKNAWEKLLWERNQPKPDGTPVFSIILRTPDDMVRLERAIMVRRTIDLNAQTRELTLQNFSLGRILQLPSEKKDKVHLIDSDVARYFFYTEQYYPAVRRVLDKDLQAFQALLKQPAFSRYAKNAPAIKISLPKTPPHAKATAKKK